jgi:hypothetical protein
MGDPERPDNPNQELVRPDASGPADEGSGGSTHEPDKPRRGRPPKPKPEPAPEPEPEPEPD